MSIRKLFVFVFFIASFALPTSLQAKEASLESFSLLEVCTAFNNEVVDGNHNSDITPDNNSVPTFGPEAAELLKLCNKKLRQQREQFLDKAKNREKIDLGKIKKQQKHIKEKLIPKVWASSLDDKDQQIAHLKELKRALIWQHGFVNGAEEYFQTKGQAKQVLNNVKSSLAEVTEDASSNDSMKQVVAKTKQKISTLQQQNKKLRSEKEKLSSKLDELKKESKEAGLSKEEKLAGGGLIALLLLLLLWGFNRYDPKEVKKLKQEVKELRQENENLQQQVEQQEDPEELQQELKELEDENSQLRDELETEQEEREKLERQLENRQEENQKLERQLGKAQEQLEQAKEELEQAQAEAEEAEQVRRENKELKEENQLYRELESFLQQYTDPDKDSLKERIDQAKERLKKVPALANKLKELKAKYEEAQARIEKLEQDQAKAAGLDPGLQEDTEQSENTESADKERKETDKGWNTVEPGEDTQEVDAVDIVDEDHLEEDLDGYDPGETSPGKPATSEEDEDKSDTQGQWED